MAHAHDKEQIEMLSKWWRDYGRGILVAIIIGLLIGFGWKYWNQRKQSHQAKASQAYMLLLQYKLTNNPAAMKNELNNIRKEFSDSPYAAMGTMLVAQSEVTANNLTAALKDLQWVVGNAKDKSLQQIAAINSARILNSQKQYAKALQMLATVKDKSFEPMVLSVQGDIYKAQGSTAKAQKLYAKAQKGYQAVNLQDPFLSMKLAS